MVLSTQNVEDFERWLTVFSTKGAEKRKQHGSKGSHVFRDPNDDHIATAPTLERLASRRGQSRRARVHLFVDRSHLSAQPGGAR